MSIDVAAARIGEIQTLLAGLQRASAPPAVASPAATGGSFKQMLELEQASPAKQSRAATAPSGPSPYAAEIEAAAQRHGIDPALLKGLIKAESGFNPAARSPAGAAGLTQLMPGTAASLGVTDPTDPAQAIEGGAKYLAQQLKAFGGDVTLALAAYNAGPGAVQKHGGVPPYEETQAYVKRVQEFAEGFR